jgi:hypothetical protein
MNQNTFDNSGTSNMLNQNVEETELYTSILSEDIYEFMENSYYGTGGYRTGMYLTPHQRELFLKNRKELSPYRNFVRPIIDSLITPVFSEEAVRLINDANGNTIEGNTLLRTFIEDVNNNGESMQCFVEQAVTFARIHGVSFVVLDNYSDEMQPPTQQEAIDQRILPYAYLRKAEDVENYTTDKFGNLTSIMFEEESVMINGKKEERYRLWTESYSQLMKEEKDDVYSPAEEPIYHNLGCLPVISVYAAKKKDVCDILVDPPMYDIARLNHSLYNKDSCIVDQERAQAFSNFYIQGDNSGNVTLGPHNVIFVPMEASMSPGFASPDSSILKGLVDNAEALKNSIFQIAQQNGVYGIQEAKSGIAMSYDFYAQEYQLHKTAYMATDLEESLVDLFMKYTNTEYEYIVQYPEEYQPGNSKSIIDSYKVVMEMQPPAMFKAALFEKMARLLLNDADETKLNAIIADINSSMSTTASNNLMQGDVNVGDTKESIVQNAGSNGTTDAPSGPTA